MDPSESAVSDFLKKDAMEMLLGDHKEVRSLLASFLTGDCKTTFTNEQSISSLKLLAQKMQIHEQLEEQIFYPSLKELWQSRDAKPIDESLEEHQAIDLIVKELIELTTKIGEEGHSIFNEVFAKTKLLGDSLESHLAKEETEIFPKAMESFQAVLGGYEGATKKLEEMAEEMIRLKRRLEQEFNSSQNLDLKPDSTPVEQKAAQELATITEEPKEKMVEESKEDQEESKPEANVESVAPEQVQQNVGEEQREEAKLESRKKNCLEKEELSLTSKEEEPSVKSITGEEAAEEQEEVEVEEEKEEEEEGQKAKKKRKAKAGRKAKGKSRAKKAAEKRTGEVSKIKQAQPAKRARTR